MQNVEIMGTQYWKIAFSELGSFHKFSHEYISKMLLRGAGGLGTHLKVSPWL